MAAAAGILFQLDAETFRTVVAPSKQVGKALIKTLHSIELLQALTVSQLEQLAQIMRPVRTRPPHACTCVSKCHVAMRPKTISRASIFDTASSCFIDCKYNHCRHFGIMHLLTHLLLHVAGLLAMVHMLGQRPK